MKKQNTIVGSEIEFSVFVERLNSRTSHVAHRTSIFSFLSII